MTRAVRCWILLIVAAPLGCGPDGGTDYQKKADAAEWKWSDDYASLLYSMSQHLDGYEVQIIRPKAAAMLWEPFTVRVLDGGDEACSFTGHAKTVFAQLGDALYVAKFCPIATGCSVVAYDLKGRKKLWECPLQGNSPPFHSKYLHLVNITMDGKAVVVYGKESNGRYIEYVDARTGKTIGHKKLPPER